MIGKRILINQFVQKPILFEGTRGKIANLSKEH